MAEKFLLAVEGQVATTNWHQTGLELTLRVLPWMAYHLLPGHPEFPQPGQPEHSMSALDFPAEFLAHQFVLKGLF